MRTVRVISHGSFAAWSAGVHTGIAPRRGAKLPSFLGNDWSFARCAGDAGLKAPTGRTGGAPRTRRVHAAGDT